MTGALPGEDTPAAHTAPASTTSRRPEADEQNAPRAPGDRPGRSRPTGAATRDVEHDLS